MNENSAGFLTSSSTNNGGTESVMALSSLISSVTAANQFKIDQVTLHSLADELMAMSDADKLSGVFFRFLGQAVKGTDPSQLVRRLNDLELRWRSVAAEGAAMGLSMLDIILSKSRLTQLHRQLPDCYMPALYVGKGMAMGFLKPRCQFYQDVQETMFSWLTVDGMGFAQAFLHSLTKIGKFQGSLPLHDCDAKTHQNVFDQGVGRFLWLEYGYDLPMLVSIINKQERHRQADLWAGIGVASTFLGAVDKENIGYLKQEAGQYAPDLAVGAALACRVRLADGCRMPHLSDVVEVLCGVNAQECAELTEQMMDRLSPYGVDINGIHHSNYHVWRKRLREFF